MIVIGDYGCSVCGRRRGGGAGGGQTGLQSGTTSCRTVKILMSLDDG